MTILDLIVSDNDDDIAGKNGDIDDGRKMCFLTYRTI